MKKYISTGGAGDLWICFLKMQLGYASNVDRLNTQEMLEGFDWVHIESNNDIKPIVDYVDCILHRSADFGNKKFSFIVDPDYITNYRKGKWSDREPISSGVDLWCPLKGITEIKLKYPFWEHPWHYHNQEYIEFRYEKLKYDFCIQVSGGAKNNRNWKFDPRILKKILNDKGYRVVLVGTDKKYYDEKDKDNMVGKTANISDALALLGKSNTFIGLSGFLNYWASSMKIKNIFLEESPQHTERYFHKEWLKYAKSIKYGSIGEILKEVNNE